MNKKRKIPSIASDSDEEQMGITPKQFLTALKKSLKLRVITQMFPISLMMEEAAALDIPEHQMDIIREVLIQMEEISTTISGKLFLAHIEDLDPSLFPLLLKCKEVDLSAIVVHFEKLFNAAKTAHLQSSATMTAHASGQMKNIFTSGTIASGTITHADAFASLSSRASEGSTELVQKPAAHTVTPFCSMQIKKNGNVHSRKLEHEVGQMFFQFKVFRTQDVIGVPFMERYHRSIMNGNIVANPESEIWKLVSDLTNGLETFLIDGGAPENIFQQK